MMQNFLYVVGAPEGPVKIGFSNNPVSRLAAIQNASAAPVLMHGCYPVADMHRDIERTVHFVLRENRLNGEWFSVTAHEAMEAVAKTGDLIGFAMLQADLRKPSPKMKKTAAPALSAKSKPGPKPSGSAKTLLSLRVDPDVIEWFKAAGPGWQSRMNAALRAFSGL